MSRTDSDTAIVATDGSAATQLVPPGLVGSLDGSRPVLTPISTPAPSRSVTAASARAVQTATRPPLRKRASAATIAASPATV